MLEGNCESFSSPPTSKRIDCEINRCIGKLIFKAGPVAYYNAYSSTKFTIELIENFTHVPHKVAVDALISAKGDLINAIIELGI